MSDESEDQRVATALGSIEQHVGAVRNNFYASPEGQIICKLFEVRMQRHLDERRRKLESIDEAGLKHLQGEILAFKLAISTLKPAK